MSATSLSAYAVSLAMIGAAPALAGSYQFITLDKPSQQFNGVAGISDTGEVVGYARAGSKTAHNYTWLNGVFTPLHSRCSVPVGINTSGTIAGTTGDGEQACVVSANGRSVLLPFPATVNTMLPAAINKAGRVVGLARQAGSAFTGFTSLGKTVTLIHPPQAGSQTSLGAIGDSGLIAGVASTSNDSASFAFTYLNGTYTTIDTGNGAGTFVGSPSFITASGLIGGNTIISAEEFGFYATKGFVLSGTTLTNYAYPGSGNTKLVGITSDGSLIGNYEDSASHTRGFIFSNGQYHTLNIPGDLGSTIVGVNASGSIVGTYFVATHSNEAGVDTHSFVGTCPPSESPCDQ